MKERKELRKQAKGIEMKKMVPRCNGFALWSLRVLVDGNT